MHFLGVIIGTTEQLMMTMLRDYQSLTVAVLANTFGLMQLVVGNEKTDLGIALVLSLMQTISLLLAITITASQVQ